jgi:amino acid transporter
MYADVESGSPVEPWSGGTMLREDQQSRRTSVTSMIGDAPAEQKSGAIDGSSRQQSQRDQSRSADPPRLARSIGLVGAVALSLALVAPSQAVNINPQAAEPLVGRAIPTAFLLAFVGVLFVAYAVTRLCQRIHGSGSLSTLVAQSLNPHAGAMTGWLLCGAYILFVVVQAVTCAIFFGALLEGLGVVHSIAHWVYFVVALALVVVGTVVASVRLRRALGVLMSFEFGTVILIVVVMAIVACTVIFSHGPQGQHFSWDVFKPTGGSNLGEAAVFGFLSFAGFEGAAALGEETKNPNRDIPIAITGTVVFAGIFFVAIIAFEVMGFGTTTDGLHSLYSSSALVGSLAQLYATTWVANLIRLGIVVGAFSALSGNILGSARILFAVTRHGYPTLPTSRLQTRQSVPVAGNLVIASIVMLFIVLWWGVLAQTPFETFAAAGTAGTLLILVAYGLTSAGAMRQVARRIDPKVPRWQAVIPVVAIAVLGYVFYKTILPLPHGGEAWALLVVAVWAVVAIATSLHPPQRFSKFLGTDDSAGPAE